MRRRRTESAVALLPACVSCCSALCLLPPFTLHTVHHTVQTKRRQYIVLEDLEEFLSESQAAAAWDMLDQDKDGQVNVQVGGQAVGGWVGGCLDRPGQAGCECGCSAEGL